MNDTTASKMLGLLDVISFEVAAGRKDTGGLDSKVMSLGAKVTSLDTKLIGLDNTVSLGFERVQRLLGHLETRVEDVETEARLFRKEFKRRVAPSNAAARVNADRRHLGQSANAIPVRRVSCVG